MYKDLSLSLSLSLSLYISYFSISYVGEGTLRNGWRYKVKILGEW